MDNRRRFLNSIRPLKIAATIFGVFPLKINISNEKSVKISFFRIFYGVCFTLFMSGYVFFRFLLIKHYMLSLSESYLFKFSGVAYPALFFFNCMSYFGHVKSYSKLMEELLKYSKILQNEQLFRKTFWITLGEVIFITLVLIAFNVSFYLAFPFFFYTFFDILDKVNDVFVKLSIALINFQYSNLLLFMYAMFAHINLKIGNLEKMRLFTPKCKNNFLNKSKIKVHPVLELMKEQSDIKPLIVLYGEICESCKTLNFVFGGSATACAAYNLITLVMQFYYIVRGQADIIMSLVLIGSLMLQQWFLLFACEMVVQEVWIYGKQQANY